MIKVQSLSKPIYRIDFLFPYHCHRATVLLPSLIPHNITLTDSYVSPSVIPGRSGVIPVRTSGRLDRSLTDAIHHFSPPRSLRLVRLVHAHQPGFGAW